MRKTFVVALIALAVLFASCDFISELSTEKPEYTADGLELVTVSVNVGGTVGNRSLNDTIAQTVGVTDYFEVIFKTPKTGAPGSFSYYRKADAFALTVKIQIPVGNYGTGGTSDAVVLLGKASDKTLLATGVITKVTYSDSTADDVAAPFNITNKTSSITFTVEALEANIAAGGGAFQIVETSGKVPGSSTLKPVNGGGTGPFSGATDNGGATYDDATIRRWFQVPPLTDEIGATLTISNFTNTGNFIIRKTSADPGVTFDPISGAPAIISPSVTSPAAKAQIGTTGVIGIQFSTPAITAEPSKYQITLKIPVVGFTEYDPGEPEDDSDPGNVIPAVPSTTPGLDGQLTWYICGGTTTTPALDFDITGAGGSVGIPLLIITDPTSYADMILEWKQP